MYDLDDLNAIVRWAVEDDERPLHEGAKIFGQVAAGLARRTNFSYNSSI